MAGSWKAKRSYLAQSLGERIGIRHWASVTHVMAVLWSAEVLHSLRLRKETFRSLCPDNPIAFDAWWAGSPPLASVKATLEVIDPCASPRQRLYCSFEDALHVRPRYRSYAEAAQRLRERSGRPS